MKHTHYKKNKRPHGNEEKQQKPFFSKANDTAVQTKAGSEPFFKPIISPFGGGAGGGNQPKLKVGQPGDKYEKEADNVADAVINNNSGGAPAIQQKEISSIQRSTLMSPEKDEKFSTAEQRMEEDKMIQSKEEEEMPVQKMEEEEPVQAKEEEEKPVQKMKEEEPVQAKEEEEEPAVQTKAANTQNTASTNVSQKIKKKSGKGRPLAAKTRAEMESGIGADFGNVNIHTDRDAQDMNKALGAQAFTHGKDVYFNSGKYNPETTEGKRLLAHELTHVVQQKGGKTDNIQRLGVDDVTSEMTGRTFQLIENLGGIKKGTKMIILDWKDNTSQAYGYYINEKGRKIKTMVNKHVLEPVYSKEEGVSKYEVGLGGQRSAVKKSQQKIDDWKAKEGEYKKNKQLWKDELTRLEGLHVKREKLMSQMLVRETMYNRFDADIKTWVDFYNKKYKPKTELTYNIVKSIIFQETRMGTSGEHLKKPPYGYFSGEHPIKSRYNLGQVIDSFGPQQYLMIKEMAPAIYKKYGFDKLEKGAKWKGRTGEEWWNENFLKAIREFSTLKSKRENLMGNKDDLFIDYEFWIRATVRWLFEKYFITKDWEEAVRAYNGSGERARNYKKAVITRANHKGTVNVGNK